jgi:osmoprotectant transport system permease protein
MDFLGDAWNFLANGDHWSGQEGIPTLFLQHLQLTGVSVAFAALIALPIGIGLGHLRKGGIAAVNIANVGRALPALALLILGAQVIGISDPSGILTPVESIPAFIAMVALAIPPMLANAYVGMAGVDDEVREAAKGMGMNGRQLLQRVELPIALPLVMAGIRTAAVAVVATATLAAYVDAGGLGRYIVDGFAAHDDTKVFVGGFLVAILALLVDFSLALLERVLVSRGLRAGGERIAREIDEELATAANAA